MVSLAILREFGSDLKPKNIFYLYFEGNDLDDLNYEKNETNLNKYLDPNYSTNYVNRYDEIRLFLKNANQESEILITNLNLDKPILEESINSGKLNNFTQHLKDIAELSNLKNIVRFSILKRQINTYDLDLFYKVVEKMKLESEKWNGNFNFVYVPSWSRYFTKYTNKDAGLKLKDKILKDLDSKKIKTIDLTVYFNETKNLKKYFPLGYIGHYNATGYKKIADIIAQNIK